MIILKFVQEDPPFVQCPSIPDAKTEIGTLNLKHPVVGQNPITDEETAGTHSTPMLNRIAGEAAELAKRNPGTMMATIDDTLVKFWIVNEDVSIPTQPQTVYAVLKTNPHTGERKPPMVTKSREGYR